MIDVILAVGWALSLVGWAFTLGRLRAARADLIFLERAFVHLAARVARGYAKLEVPK